MNDIEDVKKILAETKESILQALEAAEARVTNLLQPKKEAPVNVVVGPAIQVKSGSIWTQARADSMREIKSKLRTNDNDQLNIHIETWSGGKVRTLKDLTESNVDTFIKYMFTKYITPMKESGLQDPGALGADSQDSGEEAPY